MGVFILPTCFSDVKTSHTVEQVLKSIIDLQYLSSFCQSSFWTTAMYVGLLESSDELDFSCPKIYEFNNILSCDCFICHYDASVKLFMINIQC